jgi:putative Mg2+ transporter-C (MgtC) family protein
MGRALEVFLDILNAIIGGLISPFLSWLVDTLAMIPDNFFFYFGEEFYILQEHSALSRLIVATICGAMIGLEREWANKPAGLRTNIFICAGSALFTLASILSWQHVAGAPATVDPGRISAQIVTGVGFLGAGVILKTGLNVTGITTASTIWFVSGIGMLVGMGFPGFGFSVSLVATTLLFALGRVERFFSNTSEELEVEE